MTLCLVFIDKDISEVNDDVMVLSTTLSDLINDFKAYNNCNDCNDKKTEFPVQFSKQIWDIIVSYCKQTNSTAKYVKYIPYEWEKTFFDLHFNDIIEIINAADYLGIKRLYDGCCWKNAFFIENNTPETLREEFGEEDDLSDSQKENILTEFTWDDIETNKGDEV